MTFEVVASERFRSDVLDTFDYFEKMGRTATAIDAFRIQIEESLDLLSEFPHINQISRKPNLTLRKYREHFIGKYNIVYFVDGKTVYLVRFLHQAQDAESKV